MRPVRLEQVRLGHRPMRLARGLVHLYTGDGRGKTSIAIATALRAAQHGFRVAIIQFIKEMTTTEAAAFRQRFPEVEFLTLGEGFYKILNDRKPEAVHRATAQQAWQVAQDRINSGTYDVVVLDELCNAIDYGFIRTEEVVRTIRHRPRHVELIVTGRNAPASLVRLADYVSEVKKIKHPYDRGIVARKGIDF